jgi:type IX secretion system PorP/SprF family membrane protein
LGIGQYRIVPDQLDPKDKDDRYLPTVKSSSLKPEFGGGIFYQSRKLSLSLSSTHLGNTHVVLNEWGNENFNVRTHWYGIASYTIDLSQDLKLRPSLFTKYISGAEAQTDLSMYIQEIHTLTAGISYRTNNILSFQLMMNSSSLLPRMENEINIGYAYDHAFNGLSAQGSFANELFLTYKFNIHKHREKIQQLPPTITPKSF